MRSGPAGGIVVSGVLGRPLQLQRGVHRTVDSYKNWLSTHLPTPISCVTALLVHESPATPACATDASSAAPDPTGTRTLSSGASTNNPHSSIALKRGCGKAPRRPTHGRVEARFCDGCDRRCARTSKSKARIIGNAHSCMNQPVNPTLEPVSDALTG